MAVFVKDYASLLCSRRLGCVTINHISKLSGSSNLQRSKAEEQFGAGQLNGEKEEFYDDNQAVYNMLYPGHIQTSTLQKGLLAFGSGIACALNPARNDMLSALGETTGVPALKNMKRKMEADPEGREILKDKPELNTTTMDFDYLAALPDNTLGKEYWRFLQDNHFSPDDRHPVQFIDDVELMYVMLRYRQCHDIIHTLTGNPTNMLGEVAVKWWETIHTQLPMCAMAAAFGPLRLGPKHRQKFRSGYLPWVLRAAPKAKNIMNIYYEKRWEQDLDDFRQEMNIEVAPQLTRKTGKYTLKNVK